MERNIARDIDAIARIDSIPFILDLCCATTGLRFAAVARVDDTTWTACAVRDLIDFGLEPGGQLELESTICNEIRDHLRMVVIDHVAEDPMFRDHHTPRRYGFQSYISVPIVLPNRQFFGTLCALDPEPAALSKPETRSMFEGFARLIALQIDAQDQLMTREAALAEADRVGLDRERFIAILGHDLRNPLAAVQAGAGMLARTAMPPREQGIVSRMLEACGRMKDLIDDVLGFAQGKLGDGLRLALTADAKLEATLEQVVEEARIVHPDRDVRMTIALAEPVTCDLSRIAQLLSNLVGNALTHGDPDRPIRIDARSGGGTFTIEVCNSGEAIPADRLPTLFDPFKPRKDGSRRDGLGLGLYIVGEIARAHGGRMTATSTPEETMFTLFMPCNVAA